MQTRVHVLRVPTFLFFHFRYTPTVTASTSPTFVFWGRTPHTFPRAAASHNGRRVVYAKRFLIRARHAQAALRWQGRVLSACDKTAASA